MAKQNSIFQRKGGKCEKRRRLGQERGDLNHYSVLSLGAPEAVVNDAAAV
jgi:hypothetical protein